MYSGHRAILRELYSAHRALRHTYLQQEVEYETHDTRRALGRPPASDGGLPVPRWSTGHDDCAETQAEHSLGLQMDPVSRSSSLDAVPLGVPRPASSAHAN